MTVSGEMRIESGKRPRIKRLEGFLHGADIQGVPQSVSSNGNW